ncbi:MAG: outer membrane beta-barrel protein [Flavobacterium sp.]
MKKIALLLLCMIGLSAAAQVTFKPGIRAGVNFANITDSESDTRTDFYAGAFGAIKLSKFYTLQPEITYSRQGANNLNLYSYDYNTGNNVQYKNDVEIEYISLGLINKFTLNNAFNIHVGPYLDIQTGSNIRTDSDADTGIMAGIGYTLPFGLTVEARVKQGIIDIAGNDYYYDYIYDYSNSDDYNTNFVFQLGLSYSFDFKATGATN